MLARVWEHSALYSRNGAKEWDMIDYNCFKNDA